MGSESEARVRAEESGSTCDEHSAVTSTAFKVTQVGPIHCDCCNYSHWKRKEAKDLHTQIEEFFSEVSA